MSTMLVEQKVKDGTYWFTRFFGGTERGMMIQLTFPFSKNYIVLSKKELEQFIKDAKLALDNLK